MSADIILGIIISSIATYSSRFLGTLTSEIINEKKSLPNESVNKNEIVSKQNEKKTKSIN